MGKIVLYLADGTTLDIRLARERITIGRRADNDVCLPYPAVSGEHAAIVTILSDSFLEDLGSTNGTLVNGKPIAKHFLRDRDQIDIGRQKLVYVADESTQLETDSHLAGRHDARVFGERVEAAKPPPSIVVPDVGAIEEARDVKSVSSGASTSDIERFVAAEVGAPSNGGSARAAPRATEPARAVAAAPDSKVSALRVMTGPNSGRELILDKDETAIGRVGVQVAAVRRTDGTFRLVPLEGASAPSVNGAPVSPDGHPLKPGDSFEVAGVRIEMIEKSVVDAG